MQERNRVIGYLAIWSSHHESDKSSHYIFFFSFVHSLLFRICTRSHTQPLIRCQSKEFRVGILIYEHLLTGIAAIAHHFLFLRLRMVHTLLKKKKPFIFFFVEDGYDDDDNELFYNEHYTPFVQYVMRQIVPKTKHQAN